jgi:hypothetical protein
LAKATASPTVRPLSQLRVPCQRACARRDSGSRRRQRPSPG